MADSFLAAYLAYTKDTEPPYIYHRWTALSTIGALLGRKFYFQHGHFRVFPNIYCILVGESGARKSTAIKLVKKLVTASGYTEVSADKTSKEKFLLDLEGKTPDEELLGKSGTAKADYDGVTAANLWGSSSDVKEPREVFVISDEFKEFIGTANLEFCTTLGNLWDWDDEATPFTSRLKNSKSIAIWQPTVSILGGITPDDYVKAFPPAIIGQGFLSRMLHIHGERSGRSITFPKEPDPVKKAELVTWLQSILTSISGAAKVTAAAEKMLDSIYHGWQEIDDVRFKSYSNRRFTQLLKMLLIICASRTVDTIDESIVVEGNTYLSAAELLMPKALGEFGKSKNSDTANKLVEVLSNARKPLAAKELWTYVHKDLEKITQLADLLNGLATADKIQYARDKGWLIKRKVAVTPEFVDWSLLTEEERKSV